jgi:hypothetical protein
MTPQVIVVDDAHIQLREPGKPAPDMYVIAPATALVLDASNYTFRVPSELSGKPINSVQVIVDRGKHYSAAWNHENPTLVLSPETLEPNSGSPPFNGFASDQQLVVAIGNLEGSRFNVVWVAMAVVK